MCGIVGYVGPRQASTLLVDCLKRLEYRGYDSAGVALLSSGRIRVTRTKGKLACLEAKLAEQLDDACVGIGHTRWATHGKPNDENAHPHKSQDGRVVAVHNGIFENYADLRRDLEKAGYKLASETDTECFPMLVSQFMDGGMSFDEAFRAALRRIEGIYAIACMHEDAPNRVLVARSGPPLVIGIGNGETFLASDVTALLKHTRNVLFLEDGDLAELTPTQVRIFDLEGNELQRGLQQVSWNAAAVEIGSYRHYMQKEIFEQPQAISDTLASRIPVGDEPIPLELPWTADVLRNIERVTVIACGTSWHAGLVGKYLIEQLARMPVEVDYASEYRYRAPVTADRTLTVAITQSGETADTLAALGEARRRGARTLAICNVQGSQVTRQAEATLLTHAGPEIGVASTKAFTTQLTVLTLLAMKLAEARGTLDASCRSELVLGLRQLPLKLERLRSVEPKIVDLARKWAGATNALYLGRGVLYPIALEGALKLKEISYIHAEGYPAGEMKHGPIALIDQNMPVIALIPDDDHRARTISNVQEAAARDGQVIAFVAEGDRGLDVIASSVIEVPQVHPLLAPIVYAIPLQLFAYHVAVFRGCDVDQPRNLAKSVTVE